MIRIHPVLFLVFLLTGTGINAQSSLNISLLDNWAEDSLICNTSRVRYNDCLGFARNGREYAVAGSTEGTHVFSISVEGKFIPKGFIKGRFSNTAVSHRDYAVYGQYLYAVCDEGVSDLQIIDLQYLPDSIHLVKEDSLQFGRVHNISIDTAQALLYSCIHRSVTSTQTIEAAMKVFSLSDPLNLTEQWSGPDDIAEVHDIYVRDGKAILNCGFDGLRVYDFSSPTAPLYLSSKTFYTDQGYNHQGWLTPDGNTYLFADETAGKRLKKCAFDGTNVEIGKLFGTDYQFGSVPHNIMCTDTFAFVAYYNEGLRIYDLRYPTPLEIAHYDTYPEEHPFPMNGNWGVYSGLPSGRILASDRQYGLFLLNFDRSAFAVPVNPEAITVYPNPVADGVVHVRLELDSPGCKWELTDATGRFVAKGEEMGNSAFSIELPFSPGTYHLKVISLANEADPSMFRVVIP